MMTFRGYGCSDARLAYSFIHKPRVVSSRSMSPLRGKEDRSAGAWATFILRKIRRVRRDRRSLTLSYGSPWMHRNAKSNENGTYVPPTLDTHVTLPLGYGSCGAYRVRRCVTRPPMKRHDIAKVNMTLFQP